MEPTGAALRCSGTWTVEVAQMPIAAGSKNGEEHGNQVPKGPHIRGSYIPVPRPDKRSIPEISICRILMFVGTFGPPEIG